MIHYNHYNPCGPIALPHIGDEEAFRLYAMAISFGKLEEFDTANGDDWVQYIERMEHYFLANDITDAAKQRSILISSMGQKAYRILRNLVAPDKPTDVSFKNLVQTLIQPYNLMLLESMNYLHLMVVFYGVLESLYH